MKNSIERRAVAAAQCDSSLGAIRSGGQSTPRDRTQVVDLVTLQAPTAEELVLDTLHRTIEIPVYHSLSPDCQANTVSRRCCYFLMSAV